jgi:2,4-dienoyl-CoA reductase (NADPH2)
VNPIAAYESSVKILPVDATKKQNIAVVGAGPAGLSFAVTAAQRGHNVTLFDKDNKIGGQFNMAKMVPGKEEFYETLRYFNKQIQLTGVRLELNTTVTTDMLKDKYHSVVVATGVLPRQISLKKTPDSKVNVYSYVDVLRNNVSVGQRVAVIGAGGIGYDISDFLTHGNSLTYLLTYSLT